MRFFFDTEFMDDGDTIELISIGIVAEDGREFYVQNLNCVLPKANDWVVDNVVPHLHNLAYYNQYYELGGNGPVSCSLPWLQRGSIAKLVQRFVGTGPVFWGYYAAYDWVVLNQLYGPMANHPDGWPFYCCDLRQALDMQGQHALKQSDDLPHHALQDAQWIAETWRQEVTPPGVWGG